MTTIGADGGQQESRMSIDDPNETPGTQPDHQDDRYRRVTLTSGGDGDGVDDDDDDDDDEDEDDDQLDDDADDDASDGTSKANPA